MENQNITPLLHRSQEVLSYEYLNLDELGGIMLSLQTDLNNPEKSIKKTIINMM
jgi:predicted RNA-binding protein with RPS1 domain